MVLYSFYHASLSSSDLTSMFHTCWELVRPAREMCLGWRSLASRIAIRYNGSQRQALPARCSCAPTPKPKSKVCKDVWTKERPGNVCRSFAMPRIYTATPTVSHENNDVPAPSTLACGRLCMEQTTRPSRTQYAMAAAANTGPQATCGMPCAMDRKTGKLAPPPRTWSKT